MLERGEAVIGGARLLARAVGLKEATIGIELNKPDAIEHLKTLVGSANDVHIEGLKTRYPQGAEKQLIQMITGRQVPPGKLPADVKCVVCNVATAAAVYDAVTEGIPLTRRGVTLTGEAVAEPMNVMVPVGTPISHLIKMAGGFKETPDRVLYGGPMMGNPIYDLDVPMMKSTNCILSMTAREVAAQDPAQTCIRCGKCVEACPMHLTPLFMRMNTNKRRWSEVEALRVMDCIECGSCNYICPARLPLVQSFRTAKFAIRDEAAKAKAAKEAKEAAKA
jgi:electron transport complex protein RnfC